jgi:DNA ligase-1
MTNVLIELSDIKEYAVKFSEVAECFSRIEETSGRVEITKLLADLFKKARPRDAQIIVNLAMGQLNPPYIATQFNIAEKSIIVLLAEFLEVTEETVKRHIKQSGDLGLVVMDYEWRADGGLTVLQVYEELDRIEKISGTGSVDEKAQHIRDLLGRMTPVEAKYALRIILGKLRLGFSDMTVIDALSWMEAGDKSLRAIIENAYNVCVDLGLIAFELKEHGIQAIERMKVHIGIPIRPAAAERLPTARAIVEKLGVCVAQPKLDGFRLQIHLDKRTARAKVHFFSRNLIDMSHMFPDLTAAVASLDVTDMICEGEAIVYDPNTNTFLPFQETVKRKRKHGIEEAIESFPLRVYLFDLLYLNGKEVMSETHEERRALLLNIGKKINDSRVEVIGEKVIKTAEQLEADFNDNITAGLEGLVVKRPDAIYQPGKRNFNWIKLKRQEEGHLEDTIDCVILGYYDGAGKRASFGIGAFLVGVYNKAEDCFETIAKIGTGLTDEEWIMMRKKCDAIAVANRPKNVVCANALYPDVWVSPELVCMVRADEITISPLHAAGASDKALGYALRFPRFMGYRIDKSPEEVTTVKEIVSLYKDQF